ncbi:IDEAL domain-containing protein [Bacillus sp. FJAT-47783]|uniref:IDEAL domain-containing protein n=1 Tax=Bacillus sp. FJAT-47783 TaxID=2922712 RepID=UPI001FABA28E|nr:IDEAL domain-containing protein [Bacillus sp. FJAT-47783]
MKERKSYTEMMKARSSKGSSQDFMLDVYIQMVFDEAVFNYKKLQLEEKVNEALDQLDKERFLKLSEEYAQFVRFA